MRRTRLSETFDNFLFKVDARLLFSPRTAAETVPRGAVMKFKSHRNMSLCVWPQIERELVVTTNDKIAEVGRIERINQEAKPVDGESAMQTIVAQTAWNEDRRTVRIFSFKQVAVHLFFLPANAKVSQVRQTEVIAGAPHHPGFNYADSYDQTSGPEDLQRPASYMVSRPSLYR